MKKEILVFLVISSIQIGASYSNEKGYLFGKQPIIEQQKEVVPSVLKSYSTDVTDEPVTEIGSPRRLDTETFLDVKHSVQKDSEQKGNDLEFDTIFDIDERHKVENYEIGYYQGIVIGIYTAACYGGLLLNSYCNSNQGVCSKELHEGALAIGIGSGIGILFERARIEGLL